MSCWNFSRRRRYLVHTGFAEELETDERDAEEFFPGALLAELDLALDEVAFAEDELVMEVLDMLEDFEAKLSDFDTDELADDFEALLDAEGLAEDVVVEFLPMSISKL